MLGECSYRVHRPHQAPHLVQEARELPLPIWIDIATGRRPGSGSLAPAVPVMT